MSTDLPDWVLPELTPDQRAAFNREWDEAVAARGWVTLRCDVCNAGWWGDPVTDVACWWCWRRDEDLIVEQTRMDRERMQELVGRVEDDDPSAIAPLVALWRVAGERLGNAARWRIARALGVRGHDDAAPKVSGESVA